MKLYLVLCVGSVISHMHMSEPPAEGSEGNHSKLITRNYNINSPVGCERIQNPCNYPPGEGIKSYYAGSAINITNVGGANHDGGHLQFGFSYNRLDFAITHTECGVNGARMYEPFLVVIPDDAPSGNVTLIWAWHNRLGNREMYINCVNINIIGGKSSGSIKGKELLIGNIGKYNPIFSEREMTKEKGIATFNSQKNSEVKPSDQSYELKYPLIKNDNVIKECEGEIEGSKVNSNLNDKNSNAIDPEIISSSIDQNKSGYVEGEEANPDTNQDKSDLVFKKKPTSHSNQSLELESVEKSNLIFNENKNDPGAYKNPTLQLKKTGNANKSKYQTIYSPGNNNGLKDTLSYNISDINSKEQKKSKTSLNQNNFLIQKPNHKVLTSQKKTLPETNNPTKIQKPSIQEIDDEGWEIRRPPHHQAYKFKQSKNGWSLKVLQE